MVRFLVDGQTADPSTSAVQVDGKDANLTHFKTLVQDLHIETGIENAKTSSFQDPISRPLRTYSEENLVVSDCEPLEQPTEDLAAEFKTLQINGIQVSGEKYIEESPFKTPTNGNTRQ